MNLSRMSLTHPSLLLICILVSIGFAGSAPHSSSNFQETNDAAAFNAKGLESYKSQNYEDAVRYYKQAIKLKKDYAEARYNLGDAYFQLEQNKQAIEAYKQALQYQPNFPLAYNNMGTAYYKLGQHKKAIEAYKQSIRLDPKSGSTYYNLGATYLARGDEEAAMAEYRALKTVDPQLAQKLYLLIIKPMAGVFGASSGVRLNVIVTDSQRNPVSDLNQDDFQVLEDGIPQIITSFSKEEFPLIYGLVIDSSGSMRPALPAAIELSRAIIQSNRPNDETLLVRFVDSDEIETVQDFTSDKSKLDNGLATLFATGGQSAILDAVYLSAQRVAQYKLVDTPYLRRAVILITDGDERLSYYEVNDLIGMLRQIDVQVFSICLNKDPGKGSDLNRNLARGAEELLVRLANETGGQAFFPKSVSELSTVARQVTAMTHTQYLIGYKPTGAVDTPTYRFLTVKIIDKDGREKLRTASRAGYVIAKPKPLP